MEKENLPEHERLKRELASSFNAHSTYLGSFVREEIMRSNFKVLKNINKPCRIKKGDVITSFEGTKSRPAVVVKVLRDSTILYMPLTSTENVHCMTPFKSRFFGEGCFAKSINICTEEYALEFFIGVFDNTRALNQAIKELKILVNSNL
jgi:hypothetical protein